MIGRFFGSTIRVSVTENPNWFVSVWKTDNAGTSASNQIQLPITLGSNPNIEVDWGDGNTDFNTTLHTYNTGSGIYEITIKQHNYQDFRFAGGGDNLKCLEIKQWGNIFFASNSTGNLKGCRNMISTAIDVPDVSHKSNFSEFIRDCFLFNQPFESLSVQNGTNFEKFMMGCLRYNQPIENLPVQNGINFKETFRYTEDLNQPLGNLKIGNGIDFSLFRNGSSKMSVDNYNQTLIGWSNQVLKPNQTIDMGNNKYSFVGQAAKNQIIANYNWTFIDGGLV